MQAIAEIRDDEAVNEEMLWQAVMKRDAACDGLFVFAVRSTGIYCRPSCPARRPRRGQVEFFAAAEAAEGARFRACRRCRPELARNPYAELINEACRALDADDEEALTLDALARRLAATPGALRRAFRSTLGVTPHEYARARRLAKLKDGLRRGQTVAAAQYDAGFPSSSRLYEAATSRMGMTPATYGKGGRGQTVRYATTACDLGRLLVAATERGICAVKLGDGDGALEAGLHREFHAAEIRRDDERLRPWLEEMLARVDGREPALDLPLDIIATAFQARVWRELQLIPQGGTRSYKEVARRIGHPRAARAVARACAGNPVAVVVPCHRVVRSDGTAGGYRWGAERKQALLDRELATRTGRETAVSSR